MVNIGVRAPSDPIEQISELVDRAPEIIAKIKALFSKDEPEQTAEDDAE